MARGLPCFSFVQLRRSLVCNLRAVSISAHPYPLSALRMSAPLSMLLITSHESSHTALLAALLQDGHRLAALADTEALADNTLARARELYLIDLSRTEALGVISRLR